jgi:hypothetical protein
LVFGYWPVVTASAETGAGVAEAEPANRKELVTAIKEFQETLGLAPTGSFTRHSEDHAADYRCYYTGKLDLPDSYDGLKLKTGTKDGCPLDPEEYDIFFYPLEAVGTAEQPVTASLAKASTERFLVVVPHEDFHHSLASPRLPPEFSEAASTLLGFLTAAELARQRFGEDSAVFQNLTRESELFLRKAEIVNRYHASLSALYARARSGELSEREALAEKEARFRALKEECIGISPMPVSFSRCLGAANNAGLAFDRTYTKHYPLMFEIYLAYQRDLRLTVQAVQYVLAADSVAEVLERLETLLGRASAQAEVAVPSAR